MQYTNAARPGASNFELWTWLFMRITGILLVLLVLVHVAIMHVFTPIQDVDFDFVAARYALPVWRWYDLALLTLALLHGLNGVRVVSDDLIHSRPWRVTMLAVLYTVAFAFLVIGAQVILSFNPSAAGQ